MNNFKARKLLELGDILSIFEDRCDCCLEYKECVVVKTRKPNSRIFKIVCLDCLQYTGEGIMKKATKCDYCGYVGLGEEMIDYSNIEEDKDKKILCSKCFSVLSSKANTRTDENRKYKQYIESSEFLKWGLKDK